MNGIIAFDMDSTFIEEEGVDEIARALGITDRITKLTQQAMEGKLDFNNSFTQRIGMLKGTHIHVINAVCDRMTASPGITTILPFLKQKGFKTAIISGGLDIFTHRLQQKYQLDYIFSNTVEVRNGMLTDNISAPIMNAENKQKHWPCLPTLCRCLSIILSPAVMAPTIFPCSRMLALVLHGEQNPRSEI